MSVAKNKWNSSDRLAAALACLAAVMGIVLFWVEKTPIVAALSIVGIAALLVYPIIHFLRPRNVRILVFVAAALLVTLFGYEIWPQRKVEVPVSSPPYIPPRAVTPPKVPPPRPVTHQRPNPKSPPVAVGGASLGGGIDQGDCSVAQVGGIGNSATVNCGEKVKLTATPQIQRRTNNPERPYATTFSLSTNVPAEVGELRLTCNGPVLSASMERISSYEWIVNGIDPDPDDPNTILYNVKPELLRPGRSVEVTVFSKQPVQLISGWAGAYRINF